MGYSDVDRREMDKLVKDADKNGDGKIDIEGKWRLCLYDEYM